MPLLEELIGETLVFGIPGTRPTPADIRLFRETHAGGLILYRINYRSPEQVRALVKQMEESLGRRLLVTVDHEGGRVVMFPSGATIFPDSLAFGRAGRADWAAAQGRIEGRELRRLGMDVNFSPTVDVLTGAFSPNIGIRSYGRDPALVAKLAAARIRAMQAAGVSACAKHFPGLGPATLDPHLDLPVINVGWKELRRSHLQPFRAAIDAGVHSVMSSHPLYPNLDPMPKTPATFSRRLIAGLLREEMGYDGVISSDDLEMGALRNLCGIDRAAVLAAQAGHDLLLCCHIAELQRKVYYGLRDAYVSGELELSSLERSVERLRMLAGHRKARFAPGKPRSEPGGAALALAVSRAGTYVRESAKAPLPVGGEALIIFPDMKPLARRITIENELLDPETYFRKTLRGKAEKTRVLRVGVDPTSRDIARALKAAKRTGRLVFFCFDAHLQKGNARLLAHLEKTQRPLVVCLMRDPFDEDLVSASTTVVTAYGIRRCQIDACLEKIFPR